MLQRITPVTLVVLLMATLVWTGCEQEEEWAADGEADVTTTELAEEQEAFWDRLQSLCGEAYAGEVVTDVDGDGSISEDDELVMHVRQCTEDAIHVPFHVGDNHSRTWVFTRTVDGLRLKHDHRHEDGTEEETTQYGGDTEDAGEEGRQEFPADEYTAELLPHAATNVWTVEIEPGEEYVYSLRREGEEREFRARFDLSETVETPPAPWGYEDTQPTHGDEQM